MTVAGAASASPHGDGVSCGRKVEADSVAISTIVTRLNGLVMEVARTWQIGRPGMRRRALHDCAVMAQEAAIDAAMAGAPVSGIDAAARRVIEAAGFAPHLLHRSGHGIGVVQHDFPEDVPFNGRPLEAGELYAVEPGLYVPGVGGFRCADVVHGRGTRAAPAGAAQGRCLLHGDLTALLALAVVAFSTGTPWIVFLTVSRLNFGALRYAESHRFQADVRKRQCSCLTP